MTDRLHIAREAARVEAAHGDLDRAMTYYEVAIDLFHHSGNVSDLAHTFDNLALSFRSFELPEIAATLHGAATQFSTTMRGFHPDRLRAVLGDVAFERCAAVGAAMDPAEAVHYARTQIRLAREILEGKHQIGGTP